MPAHGNQTPGTKVTIDRSSMSERCRYACPHGHTAANWSVGESTNRVWCRGCRRLVREGELRSAVHYQIIDLRTDETIPFCDVVVTD